MANELTLTGSIGVIMHGWNYRGLMDKVGVAPMTYKSGKFKDMLSGERATNEIPAEEHAMVQGLIDETYGQFTNVVAEGRSAAHELNKKEGQRARRRTGLAFADGRVVSGKEALDRGFVDELGDFDDAVDRAQKIAGIQRLQPGRIPRALRSVEFPLDVRPKRPGARHQAGPRRGRSEVARRLSVFSLRTLKLGPG